MIVAGFGKELQRRRHPNRTWHGLATYMVVTSTCAGFGALSLFIYDTKELSPYCRGDNEIVLFGAPSHPDPLELMLGDQCLRLSVLSQVLTSTAPIRC